MTDKNKKSWNRGFSSNERMDRMIDDLIKIHGFSGVTTLFQVLVSEKHRKVFPLYATAGNSGKSALTPEEQGQIKARVGISKKEAELKSKLDKKRNICVNLLLGEVDESDDDPICIYRNFTPETDFHQRLPLMSVTEDLQNNLFIPSKEAVFNKRPDLKEELKSKLK